MSSKHFVNEPTALVQQALQSLTVVNPSVSFDAANKTVYLTDAAAASSPSSSNVAVVSGGGSGHEPSFAGLVGSGLLSGAVAGSIFASPSAEQVFRCLLRLGDKNPRRGILVVVMNYTGDKLHFGMAVEKARAHGLDVDMLVIGDDVGVGRKRSGRIGRRGLAGTVLVDKIAGALSAQGASLADVTKIASSVAENMVTVGASLAHVHVPGRPASKDDELDTNDEIEIGMGIHNEEGFGRVRADLPGLVSQMLRQLLDESDADRGFIHLGRGDDAVLLVNNLGGVSPLEMGAATMEVAGQLARKYGIVPKRVLSGTYMTSLNGTGFSVTLLKVVDQRFLDLIDAPAQAPGWSPPLPGALTPSVFEPSPAAPTESKEGTSPRSNLTVDPARVATVLERALGNVIAAEPEVTRYDTLVGDGDCGLCLKGGAEAVLSFIRGHPDVTDAVQLVASVAHVVETSMDGTSGALYAIFLNGLAYSLGQADGAAPQPATAAVWARGLAGAVRILGQYTPARPGDRTVVDALAPFVEALERGAGLEEAVGAAARGCDGTKGMEASLGRSVYVGGDEFKNCPDPGAYGLVAFLKGLVG